MATTKSYTDLEQSKKLAEILPLESADMYYKRTKEESEYKVYVGRHIAITYNLFSYRNGHTIPCWSLAALLNVLNIINGWYPGIDAQVGEENYWQVVMFSYNTGSDTDKAAAKKELIDACYEVIIKCKEQKLL